MTLPNGALQAAAPHEDGHWISAKVNRTVEILKDYDPNLEIVWIPPENRAPGEAAFLICEKTPTGIKPIFSVKSEEYMDERLLERIFQNDSAKHKNILSEMDARNAARKAMILKEKQDELEEMQDMHAHILKSPKTRYKAGGKVYE